MTSADVSLDTLDHPTLERPIAGNAPDLARIGQVTLSVLAGAAAMAGLLALASRWVEPVLASGFLG